MHGHYKWTAPWTVTAVLALGIAVRVLLISFTAGTSDAQRWEQFAAALRHQTIAEAYRVEPMLNHPPPALFLLRAADRASLATGLRLGTIIRISQAAADGLLFLVLYYWFFGGRSARARYAVLYFASPVVILASSFHVNTDALLMLVIVTAMAVLMRGHDYAAGMAIGAACGIKVLPLILMPVIAVAIGPRRFMKFALGTAAVVVVTFAPSVAGDAGEFFRSVLGYGGGGPRWSLGLLATLTGRMFGLAEKLGMNTGRMNEAFYDVAPWLHSLRLLTTGASIAAATALTHRYVHRAGGDRGRAMLLGVMTCFSLVLATAPSVGVHYLLWILPLLPLVLNLRTVLATHAVLSSYLMVFYLATSAGTAPIRSDLTHVTWTPATAYLIEAAAAPAWVLTAWIASRATLIMWRAESTTYAETGSAD